MNNFTSEPEIDCSLLIDSVLKRGGQSYDETRFRYITSLHKRSISQRQAVSAILTSKIQTLLQSYQADLLIAEDKCKVLSRRIVVNFPEHKNAAKELEKNYNVTALIKLEERLMRVSHKNTIHTLTHSLLHNDRGSESEDSFSDLLVNQEQQAMLTYAAPKSGRRSDRKELKSARFFRESQERRYAENVVRLAVKDGPDNPGPINPHMLAIRSLSMMQSLSPNYLKHFLSYIDTVFWLEQANERSATKDHIKQGGKPTAR